MPSRGPVPGALALSLPALALAVFLGGLGARLWFYHSHRSSSRHFVARLWIEQRHPPIAATPANTSRLTQDSQVLLFHRSQCPLLRFLSGTVPFEVYEAGTDQSHSCSRSPPSPVLQS